MLRSIRDSGKRVKLIWWVLIIVTVVTFVFMFGAGFESLSLTGAPGAIGTVDGKSITREEWLMAVEEQRQRFRAQYGVDPADRDAKGLETQAWRSLVARRLFERQARREGIRVSPREIVFAMQTSPPAAVTSAAAFQTNGQFDPQKYAAALRDPNNNWSGIEELLAEQLPVRKYQERMISSIKLSEPELMQAFRDRFDRAIAAVVFIPGVADTAEKPPTEAELQSVYEKYKSRFATSARTQLEMLIVPKTIGESEISVARETAAGFANRARAGEDWNGLVRDYSDLQTGSEGGAVDRVFQPMEFGPELGPRMATMKVGDISDPLRDGTRFIVFKLLERTTATPTQPAGVRVGQLVVKIRPDEEKLRQQYADLQKIRKRAEAAGLGTAASEAGLSTTLSEYYNPMNAPQALFGVPEAADWGLGAKADAVSPIFEGADEFAVVQVRVQQPAGIVPRDRVGETLRQIAQIDARVERAKATADAVSRAVQGGQTLEQAAAANGLGVQRIENLTRRNPDPRVASAPEFVGALFAGPAGKVIGPVRGLNGWYFGRLEAVVAADTSVFSQQKGQISNEILNQRQQSFFSEMVSGLRARAKVTDHRVAAR